jgi:hypothetical protein
VSGILTALHYPCPPPWAGNVDELDRSQFSLKRLTWEIWKRSRRYETVVLDGSERVDQLVAALMRRRRRPPRIHISECTWGLGSTRAGRLARAAGIRAVDGPSVTYCVLSREEREVFSRTWKVDQRRVEFTPFCHTLTDEDLREATAEDGAVFAGGDSLRDYDTLVEAARRLSVRVEIACDLDEPDKLPSNVSAGRVPHSRFMEMMRHAAVVVVPLEPAIRSAGQQTYLNAMALGKAVVVTDTVGVRDYIEHERTGLIVPPRDPSALAAAIEWVLEPAHSREVSELKARAREESRERFSPASYVASILRGVDGPAS